jgi:hypothetical protein
MKRTAFLAVPCLAAALLFSRIISPRYYPLPGHGTLLLQVPAGWLDRLVQPPGDMPPTVTFSPRSGAAFEVLVTAGWPTKPGEPLMDRNELKRQVEMAADKAQPRSLEKVLVVKELAGLVCRGFYFSASDRAPKPGEYKYLTQGIARVRGVLLVFTVLSNDGQEAIVRAALDMVRGAGLHPDAPGR